MANIWGGRKCFGNEGTMEWYLLQPDSQLPLVSIYPQDSSLIEIIFRKEKEKIPEQSVFQVKEVPVYGVPDILFSPLLMVSKLFFKSVQIYHPYVKAKPVILRHGSLFLIYYILPLPDIDIKEGDFDLLHHAYDVTGQNRMIISLDLAESLLRRGAFGFYMEEVR